MAGPHLEGLPPHLVSGVSRAGVPNRLLAGFDALTGRARLLAERFVDRLGLSSHEGRAPKACGREEGADPRAPLPERSGVVVKTPIMKLSSSTSDSSSVKRKP